MRAATILHLVVAGAWLCGAAPDFTAPLAGFTAPLKDAAWSGPYLNSPAQLPASWLTLEAGLFLLEGATLYHAWRTGRIGLFVGYVLYSWVLELAAYGTDCIRHGQFSVMLTNYLPMKESLWYPLAFYPVGIAVERLRPGLGWWGVAAAGAAIHQTHNLAYDWQGQTPGLQMFIVNPEYEWADLAPSKAWHSGLAGIFLSHLGIGGAAAVATVYSTSRGLGQWESCGVVTASSLASNIPWWPYHWAKAVVCAAAPPAAVSAAEGPVAKHVACVRSCPLTDETIWLVTLAGVLALFFAAMLHRRPDKHDGGAAACCNTLHWSPVAFVAGYHLLFLYVVMTYTAASSAVLTTMASVSVVGVTLHVLAAGVGPAGGGGGRAGSVGRGKYD